MSAPEAKKATSQSGNYQESTTAPLLGGDDTDENAGNADEQDALCLSEDVSRSILAGVDKVSTLISRSSIS